MRACAALAVSLALLLVAGCGGDRPLEPPNAEPPGYSGTVEDASEGRILVREAGDRCGIWLAAAEDVEVFRATAGGGYEHADWTDVVEGTSADVWIPGPIAESCPMQATAAAVVIRDSRVLQTG